MARSVLKQRPGRVVSTGAAVAGAVAATIPATVAGAVVALAVVALAVAALAVALLAPLGCAGPAGEAPPAGKYPHRSAGCEIALYHTAVPGAAVWDDLGVAEVSCHVNTPLAQCTQLLKAEACRMGGDLIYNVPRTPLRPQDQVVLLRGQVAHTLPGKPLTSETDGADLPPPASKEESAGPVVPLTGPAAPKEPGP